MRAPSEAESHLEGSEYPLDEVILAGGDAAGNQQQVSIHPLAQQQCQLISRVWGNGQNQRVAAGSIDLSCQNSCSNCYDFGTTEQAAEKVFLRVIPVGVAFASY